MFSIEAVLGGVCTRPKAFSIAVSLSVFHSPSLDTGVPPEQTEIIPQGEGAVLFTDDQRNDYDPGNIINRRVVLQLACEDRPAEPPLVAPPVCETLTPVRCIEGAPVREPVWYAPLSVVD
jgi:hypothetical protein